MKWRHDGANVSRVGAKTGRDKKNIQFLTFLFSVGVEEFHP